MGKIITTDPNYKRKIWVDVQYPFLEVKDYGNNAVIGVVMEVNGWSALICGSAKSLIDYLETLVNKADKIKDKITYEKDKKKLPKLVSYVKQYVEHLKAVTPICHDTEIGNKVKILEDIFTYYSK